MTDSADILARIEELLARHEGRWPRWQTLPIANAYSSLSQKSLRRMIAAGQLTAHRPRRGTILLDKHQIDAVISSATTAVRVGRGRSEGTRQANRERAVARGDPP